MLVIISFVSCSKKLTTTQQQQVRPIRFSCGEISRVLKVEEISRVYFPSNLKSCLYDSGFNGSAESNKQIALIIDVLGHEFVSIFGNREDYRGPEIFEALLRRAEIPKKRSANLYYAKKMIKTIGEFSGIETEKYVKKISGYPEYIVVSGKGSNGGDKKWNNIYYKTIVDAWKSGQIILKDYGEE